MSKKNHKDKKIVLTGQYLGVVEEYLPDKKSTFIKDGQIFATKSGLLNIDEKKKEIKIKTHQEKDRKIVRKGDIVIGTVVFLRKYSVGLNFYIINDKIHFNSDYFGNIHVSQVSDKFVEKIEDAFQITDIIRGRVIEQETNEYKLSTVGKDLGVVYADCVICGESLDKIGYNKLKCHRCGNIETRKLSNDYGDVNKDLKF